MAVTRADSEVSRMADSALVVLTIGHSTRSLAELADLIRRHGGDEIVDVRKMPGSRRHPQFNAAFMSEALRDGGVGYRHVPELGGLRPVRAGSLNSGWRNRSFRAYADYMREPEFKRAVEDVRDLASSGRNPVLMCAEAVPWRCHRWLIADALVVRGCQVRHLLDTGNPRPHSLTSFARVEGDDIIYPDGGD
jgi:uncharacterized protein (DUF488 family)